jgi:hypothetical protein
MYFPLWLLCLIVLFCVFLYVNLQGRPLGGASGAFAPGADFEGAPKRQLPTGHTLIRSTAAWLFPHLQTKRVTKNYFFKFGCISFSLQIFMYRRGAPTVRFAPVVPWAKTGPGRGVLFGGGGWGDTNHKLVLERPYLWNPTLCGC